MPTPFAPSLDPAQGPGPFYNAEYQRDPTTPMSRPRVDAAYSNYLNAYDQARRDAEFMRKAMERDGQVGDA
jgi:hypothetical protein